MRRSAKVALLASTALFALAMLMVPMGSVWEMTSAAGTLAVVVATGASVTLLVWAVGAWLEPVQAGVLAQLGGAPGLVLMWLVGLAEFGLTGHPVAALFMVFVAITVVLGGFALGAFVGLGVSFIWSGSKE